MFKWSLFSVIDEAKKYPDRSTFAKKKRNAYNMAKELGILDSLFPRIIKPRKAKPLSPPLSFSPDTFELSKDQNRALNTLEISGDTFRFFVWLSKQPMEVRPLLLSMAKEENPMLTLLHSVTK